MTDELYVTDEAGGDGWRLLLGDSCERLGEIGDESVDLSVHSPPFDSLYTYSDSVRDLGNSASRDEFLAHYAYVISDLLRVTRPGRVACVHVMDLSTTKAAHGVIGLTDFSGQVVQAYQAEGWTYVARITIRKNPQAAATRTHAQGLAFAQLRRDRSMTRPVHPDYLLIFRKPGENLLPVDAPITGLGLMADNDTWIRWAEAIWDDVRETRTLNVVQAREDRDERHICLAAGSLVLTKDGYVPIEDVPVGTEVLTHAGRWMPVLARRCNGIEPVIRTCAQGVADLRTTADHQLWIRRAEGAKPRAYARAADPEWIRASEALGSYLNLRLPPIEDSALTVDECWVVGRWLGDGHRASAHRRSGTRGGTGQFVISCADGESAGLLTRLGRHAGHIANTGTAVQIALRDLSSSARSVLARCGEDAASKRVPGELLALPPIKAEAVLAGYLSADGHYVEQRDQWMASSVSRALLLGMALVAQQARGVVASVYAGRPERKHMIAGRTVLAKQDWIFGFRNSPGYRQSGWIGDDGAWKKVRRSEPAGHAEVWDLQIAGDGSFVAEGAAVHNCPLSLDIVERCVLLWSNPGETVLSPFAGIGSEGWGAVRNRRRFVGIELKPSYWKVAVRNLQDVERDRDAPVLFDLDEMTADAPA